MFEVSENSVRSYVATPKFLLRDGYVSLADSSSIRLRPLTDVVHGHTVDGRPYWRFKVEDRYFDGYSLAGLPPEIVKTLGCEPDGRNTRARSRSPLAAGPFRRAGRSPRTLAPTSGISRSHCVDSVHAADSTPCLSSTAPIAYRWSLKHWMPTTRTQQTQLPCLRPNERVTFLSG